MTYHAIVNVQDQLQGAMSSLNKTTDFPCTGRHGGDSCLTIEDMKGAGFNAYNDDKLCTSCSAFWHVGVANNRLQDLLRLEQLRVAERERLDASDRQVVAAHSEALDRLGAER